MNVSFENLFVYVPKGIGAQFVKSYAKSEDYAKKIVFVEDTGEIWTRGKAFGKGGCNCDSVSLKAEIMEALNASIEEKMASSSFLTESSLNEAIEEALGKEVDDRNLAISEAVGSLKSELLGDDFNETLDSFAEISAWISEHGQTLTEINETLEQNSNDIATLKADKETEGSVDYKVDQALSDAKAYTDELGTSVEELQSKVETLESELEDIKNTSIWYEFIDQDSPEAYEESLLQVYSIDEVESLENTEEISIKAESEEVVNALFANPSAQTFKNIIL